MSYFTQKLVDFNFISDLNYKNYRHKISQDTLLTEYIFDFSLLCIIIIDDVTSMFNREDHVGRQIIGMQCKQCLNKTYSIQIHKI
jgi:hypothetical protein